MRKWLYTLVIVGLVIVIGMVLESRIAGEGDTPTTDIAGPSTTVDTTVTSTTRPSSTTTTTLPPGPPSPINGLPVADEDLLDRLVVPVKVDNETTVTRPQSGLQNADAVIEYLCYADSTRYMVIFHSDDSDWVGPIRSIRPTDSTLVARMGPAIFASAGSDYIRALTLERGVNYIRYDVFGWEDLDAPGPFWVRKYSSTFDMREAADEQGYDDEFYGWLYEVAEWESLPADDADTITLQWSGIYTVEWVYEDGVYKRFANGAADMWLDEEGATRWAQAEYNGESLEAVAAEIVESGHGGQLEYDVLVVLKGEQSIRFPPEWSTKAATPQTQTLGENQMLIFYQGRVLEGTWERSGFTDAYLLFDNEGNPVTVPPGLPWISIFPDNSTVYPLTYE